MHILIFNHNQSLPQQGGMERVTDLLARLFVEHGHNVTLLYTRKNRLGVVYVPPCKMIQLSEVNRDARGQFKRIVEQEMPDAIIDQCEGGIIGPFGIYPKRPDFLSQTKLIAVVHSSAKNQIDALPIILKSGKWWRDLFYIPLKVWNAKRVVRMKYRSIALNYDWLVALSSGFFGEILSFAPALAGKLVSIPNPLNYDMVNLSVEKINEILFVGRMDNNAKGIDRLLRIWSMLFHVNPSWKLTLVGEGKDRAWLEQYAVELGLENYSFVGQQLPTSYYERAKLFCMTSSFEGFGMVLTEAMQHATVPVAFDSYAAAKDIITNGQDGCLVVPFDEEQYAKQLSRLMSDEALRTQFALKGIKSVQQFSKNNVWRRWETLLSGNDNTLQNSF